MKILVTDGHLKAALSAVRALGRRGYEVHTIQNRQCVTLSSLSAFHRESHILPPYESAGPFDAELLRLVDTERFDYILPASEGAIRRLSTNRGELERRTRMDLPPDESLQLVLSKVGLLRFAQSIGIPTPRTLFSDGGQTAERIQKKLGFPIVAKSAKGDTFDRVTYLNRPAELKTFMARAAYDETLHFQEYVGGQGFGCSMLFGHGKPLLCHMHERIWEYPVTGGPSVYARTVDDPVLRDLGTRLLTALDWNGLAMVEFKKSRIDGRYRLMEINPRLWGSLDLAIAAGADFPYLAVQEDRAAALKTLASAKASYLWLVPDSLLFALARPSKALALLTLACSPRVHKNVCWGDLRPLPRQMRELCYWIRALSRSGRLRYPHGNPRRVEPQPAGDSGEPVPIDWGRRKALL